MRERWPIWKGVAALIEHVVSASLDFHHVAVFVDNIAICACESQEDPRRC